MRRLLLLVPIALVLVPSATGHDARIRPGLGIGKVDLGLTQAQVRRAMGRHDTGWSESRGLNVRYLELTWDRGPDNTFAVGFLGRPGALRVATMWTTQRRERTPSGFGPGSSRRELLRRVRGLRCQNVWRRDGSGHIVRTEFVLGRRGGPETVFVPGLWSSGTRDTTRTIAYVIVRRPGTEPHLRSERTPCR
jgi:hypothetical protein